MTKAELERDRDEWKQQAESLEDELNSLDEAYTELEEENFRLSNSMKINGIRDLDFFLFKLKSEGLMTEELESFIENYLRWYNTGGC